jgi:hypothetical protein
MSGNRRKSANTHLVIAAIATACLMGGFYHSVLTSPQPDGRS